MSTVTVASAEIRPAGRVSVVTDEQKEHEKGTDVDHHPQNGWDPRHGEEQQSLPGCAGVADERGGAPIGRSLCRIAGRKGAEVFTNLVTELERPRRLERAPSLHRRPLVLDDRMHVANKVVPNVIARLGRVGAHCVVERDKRTRLLLRHALDIVVMADGEDHQQTQQQAIRRPDKGQCRLVFRRIVGCSSPVQHHRRARCQRRSPPRGSAHGRSQMNLMPHGVHPICSVFATGRCSKPETTDR